MTKGWFAERLRSLVRKMTTLTFITWVTVLVVYIANKQHIDMAFLGFTAAVIGIKVYGDKTGGVPPTTTGGAA